MVSLALNFLAFLAGVMVRAQLPSQPVMILIAFFILFSAIHAIRPLIPGREIGATVASLALAWIVGQFTERAHALPDRVCGRFYSVANPGTSRYFCSELAPNTPEQAAFLSESYSGYY